MDGWDVAGTRHSTSRAQTTTSNANFNVLGRAAIVKCAPHATTRSAIVL
eukprot:SAG11_NODE_32924_length_280_cov_0.569061_1_plen_48_part_10